MKSKNCDLTTKSVNYLKSIIIEYQKAIKPYCVQLVYN